MELKDDAEAAMQRDKQNMECDMYDIIATEIKYWKRFGRILYIEENTIERFDIDYRNVYEKVYQCILKNNQSSGKQNWSYWKEKLLIINEVEIINTIEMKFPDFTVASRSAREVHICFEKKDLLATIAHNATGKENYLLSNYNLKSYIRYYKGTGVLTRCVIEDVEEFKRKIFKNHTSLLDCKIFSFSNTERVECKVIENCENLLQNEDGFVIRGYDARKNLQFYSHDFKDKTPYKDSYVLLCLVKHNTIILIDTNPIDIKKALINNRTYIKFLRKLHPCLNGRAILFLSVVLWEDKTICGSCEELELIVSKTEFEDPTFLKHWLEKTKNRISILLKELYNQSSPNKDVSNLLKKEILEFVIGFTSFKMDEENTQINLTMVRPDDFVHPITVVKSELELMNFEDSREDTLTELAPVAATDKDIAFTKLFNWRRFGRLICMTEKDLDDIEHTYKSNYEKIYHCFNHMSSKDKTINWKFCRKKLLNLGEAGEIADIIERKYQTQLNLRNNNNNKVHICIHKREELVIVAHNANIKDNFKLLPFKLKRLELHSLKNQSEVKCNILNIINKWLTNNTDGGFAIKGYDVKHHLKHIYVDSYNENPYKDSYILVYLEKYNTILYIDTDPADINTAISYTRASIRYLRTLHQCLVGKFIVFIPITLLDENTTEICERCNELQLVVTKQIFRNEELLIEWLNKIEISIRKITEVIGKSNQTNDIAQEFLSSINSFMYTLDK